MKISDTSLPEYQEKQRKVILKGKLYKFVNTTVMALETTCNLTKKEFKAVCINVDETSTAGKPHVARFIGTKMVCEIHNYLPL